MEFKESDGSALALSFKIPIANVDRLEYHKTLCKFDIKSIVTIMCGNQASDDYYLAVESYEGFLKKRYTNGDVIAWSKPE